MGVEPVAAAGGLAAAQPDSRAPHDGVWYRQGLRKMSEDQEAAMQGSHLGLILAAFAASTAAAQPLDPAMIARAKSLEMDTPYVAPPGDPLAHHTAGYANVMCSAVFITGLDPDFAAENVGFFTGPYAERRLVGKPVIDRANRAVHITMPNGVTRTARQLGS